MTASGNLSLRESHLAAGLADCPAFQALVGAADTAAAAEFIFFDRVLPERSAGEYSLEELVASRPNACIWTENCRTAGDGRGGTGWSVQHSAELRIALCRNVPAEDEEVDIDADWKNTVGSILDELAARAGRPDFLAAEYSLEHGDFGRVHPDYAIAEGDHQVARITARVQES